MNHELQFFTNSCSILLGFLIQFVSQNLLAFTTTTTITNQSLDFIRNLQSPTADFLLNFWQRFAYTRTVNLLVFIKHPISPMSTNEDKKATATSTISNDRVAVWDLSMNSGLYSIEFEHGTTTGKRVIRVNGEDLLRKDWMFKLVGNEEFKVGDSQCRIRIEPFGLFAYRYSLDVNDKPFKQFIERQSKILKTWAIKTVDGSDLRVVLEKDTMDIWVNGQKVDTQSEFVDGGTRTHFEAANSPATLHALCTGMKKQPMLYSLTFNGEEIPESHE